MGLNYSEIIQYFQCLPINSASTFNMNDRRKEYSAEQFTHKLHKILSLTALDEILTQMLIARKKGVIKERNFSALACVYFNAAMQTLKHHRIGTVMSEEQIRNTSNQYMDTYRFRLSEGKAKKKARELHRFVKSQLSSSLPTSNVKAPEFSQAIFVQHQMFGDSIFDTDFFKGANYVNYSK